MLKFMGDDERGRTLIGVGLTEENVQRLKEGRPIVLDLESLLRGGAPARLAIYYGATDAALAQELAESGVVEPGAMIDLGTNYSQCETPTKPWEV